MRAIGLEVAVAGAEVPAPPDALAGSVHPAAQSLRVGRPLASIASIFRPATPSAPRSIPIWPFFDSVTGWAATAQLTFSSVPNLGSP